MNDRIALRFMAEPKDAAVGGQTIAAGSVLEWIDRAGYACAVGWSSSYCVTAYVGNIHAERPILPGELVQVQARVIHTGRTSMQVLVVVESANVRDREYEPATHCILVFVAVDDHGKAREVPPWTPQSAQDQFLNGSAVERLRTRRAIRDAMDAEVYSDEGTTPRTVLRFLAAPAVVNWGGNAHGGTVMRWIDEAAFACAASWTSSSAVAVYSGGIHFSKPIKIGAIVEVDARIIHTGHRSMHIAARVRSGSVEHPDALELTTQCMSIFIHPDGRGRAATIPPMQLRSAEDHRLDAHARTLVELRGTLVAIPVDMLRE